MQALQIVDDVREFRDLRTKNARKIHEEPSHEARLHRDTFPIHHYTIQRRSVSQALRNKNSSRPNSR
jgi:hypothetical protein